MKFVLEDDDWRTLEQLLIEPLKRHGAEVWIFGSRARGDARRFSDIDVLYHAKEGIPPGLIGELRSRIEESDLPIKADVVAWEDLDRSYRSQVLAERVKV